MIILYTIRNSQCAMCNSQCAMRNSQLRYRLAAMICNGLRPNPIGSFSICNLQFGAWGASPIQNPSAKQTQQLRIANCALRIILCIANCKLPIKNKEPVPKKQWQSKTLFGVRACKRYKRARFHPSVLLIPVRFARQRWYRRGVPVNAFQRVSILSFDRMTGGTCPLSCSAQNFRLRLLYHAAAELSSGYFAFGDLYKNSAFDML